MSTWTSEFFTSGGRSFENHATCRFIRLRAFILLAVQSGLRLSEMTGLQRRDIVFGTDAPVRVIGKGRKERCTPIARSTLLVLKVWLREPQRGDRNVLFPNARGQRLSVHGAQYLLNKHRMEREMVRIGACACDGGKQITHQVYEQRIDRGAESGAQAARLEEA